MLAFMVPVLGICVSKQNWLKFGATTTVKMEHPHALLIMVLAGRSMEVAPNFPKIVEG